MRVVAMSETTLVPRVLTYAVETRELAAPLQTAVVIIGVFN
jgi:hypothetical protein